MKPFRIALFVPVVLAVLVASACGGSSSQSVPADSVAVVDGTSITTAELEALIGRAKKSYQSQKRAFPKAGTVEYQSLQTQAVAFLVQRAEYDKKADEMKLTVTDKEVAARLALIKKQYYSNSQATLSKQLAQQGLTAATFRSEIKEKLLSEKIYESVTKSSNATNAQVVAYYNAHKSQFMAPESRNVRHILVKTKAEAEEFHRWYAEENADWDAVDNLMRLQGLYAMSFSPEMLEMFRGRFAGGHGVCPLIGSPDDVAAGDRAQAVEVGVDGVAELDRSGPQRTVRTVHREYAGLRVDLRPVRHQRADVGAARHVARRVDEEELAVAGDASRGQLDRLRVVQAEPLDRCDGQQRHAQVVGHGEALAQREHVRTLGAGNELGAGGQRRPAGRTRP